MRIYVLLNRKTEISCGECDSLATAQIIASGISGRELEWEELVTGDGDDIGLNWLSDDGKWDIAETHLITYEGTCKTWLNRAR